MKLNLGSYTYPLRDYWNVDIKKWGGVDQVVDLNVLPWPFADNSFQEIKAVDILEHLGKLTKIEILQELARIIKVGGSVEVRVPCGTHPIALQSIQHAHSFYFDSFESSYAQPYFECMERQVTILAGRYRFKFQRPFRPLFRFMGRLGLIYCLEFKLTRTSGKLKDF